MKWLKQFLRRREIRKLFNPWNVIAGPEHSNNDAFRSSPARFKQNADTEMAQTLGTASDLESVAGQNEPIILETPLPQCEPNDDPEDYLGIGAYMNLPWGLPGMEGAMANNRKPISVSETDIGRVSKILNAALNWNSGVTAEYMRVLTNELREAQVLPVSHLPRDVVAINSRVWATDLDSGKKMVLTLVMPEDADTGENRISILSPLGMALFGYRAGDCLEWGPFNRSICLRIDCVTRSRTAHTER